MVTERANIEWDHFQGIGEGLLIDTSEDRPVYLLIGRNGSHIRLSPSAYHLLRMRRSGDSAAEIASELSQQMSQDITAEDVDAACQHIFDRIAEIEKNASPPRPGFLFRFSLIPERWVARVASYLSIAYHPVIAACLLGAIVALIPAVLLQNILTDFAPGNFWIAYGLLLVSILAHEFGHASACAHFGTRPSDIGFTTYFIYPTFYSNVSAAWKLRRWQRVIVDVGGMFFQLIVGAVYAAAYIVSGWQPLLVALLMILGSCVFSLNPIFRFDGYWIITDALGVTNLGQQPRRILRYLLNRLRRRPASPLPWSMPVKIMLLPYTLLSIGFWAYFVWMIVPMLHQRIGSYPGLVMALINDVLQSSHTISVDRIGSLLMSTYMVLITLLMVWRLGKPVLRAAKNAFVRSFGRV